MRQYTVNHKDNNCRMENKAFMEIKAFKTFVD